MSLYAASSTSTPTIPWLQWMRSGEWQRGGKASIPMLPALAQEVMEIALDPDVPANRIAMVVSKDPVLAGRVLQVANSAASAAQNEITSIQESVVRIGVTSVRNIVTAACLSSMMTDRRVYGEHGRDLVDHSIGTAYLARLVADQAGENGDEAFVYGLMHDVGKFVILKLANSRTDGVAPPPPAELERFLAAEHGQFGGYFLKQSELSDSFYDPVVWHHEPEQAGNRPVAAAVAYVANRLAHRYGFGCAKIEDDPLEDPYFVQFRIDEKVLGRFDQRAPGLFEVARKIVG